MLVEREPSFSRDFALRNAPQHALQELYTQASARQAPAGTHLLHAGRVERKVILLESGIVGIGWSLSAHRNMLAALVRGPLLLCADAPLSRAPNPYDAVAKTAVSLWVVEAKVFTDWVAARPEVALGFIKSGVFVQQLLLFRHRQEQRPLDARVADLLLSYLAATENERSYVALVNEQIARDLGVVVRSVSSAVSSLQRTGAIRREAKGIVVLDPDVLMERAGSDGSFLYRPERNTWSVPSTSVRGELELVGTEGEDRVETSWSFDDSLVIGGEEAGAARLSGDESRLRHCRVFRASTSGRFWVEDLQSATGLVVSGRARRRAALRDGDMLQIAGRSLRFREHRMLDRSAD